MEGIDRGAAEGEMGANAAQYEGVARKCSRIRCRAIFFFLSHDLQMKKRLPCREMADLQKRNGLLLILQRDGRSAVFLPSRSDGVMAACC